MEKDKEEIKYQKVRVRNNKEMEMGKVKQTSKQKEMRECYERRQVGGTEKVDKKSKEVPLTDRKKNN